ncbi:caspase family protein [Pseudenhygromyxa sp. WMMC2535]|uniref:caspase family protein n=1 Tax=Pseudenhygromyxa sp. WMMC2535 TaxID=2712867 RepID=UPI001556D61C|nr:caspase family protein [Pseudenhygromyxa sp. WMMC2535]
MAQALEARFDFEFERCVGPSSTREGILTGLDEWIDRCRRDQAEVCLFYYFGHGGRAEFGDLEALAGERLGYVTCRRESAGEAQSSFEAVLGIELSAKLSSLADEGRSVVCVLDCCYAGQVIREGRGARTLRRTDAPAWARAVLSREYALAADSHPGMIRLVGGSAKAECYAKATPSGHIGHFTQALLDTFEEFDAQRERLTWGGLARRVRQRVFEKIGEGQWVCFAGPHERLLFSSQDSLRVHSVGMSADAEDHRSAWLRAGALQGVVEGQHWGVLSPLAEVGGRPALLAEGQVVNVELNRSRLRFAEGIDVSELKSNAAMLLFDVEGGEGGEGGEEEERRALEVAWLSGLRALCDGEGPWPRSELPFAWTWARGDGQRLPHEGARVSVDDRIWLRFDARTPRATHWFINVIYVDASGRPWQLNSRLPQGLEIERGDREALGWRVGAGEQGLRLPSALPGRAQLVLLATTSPLELGHLVHAPAHSSEDAFAMQGLRVRASGLRKGPSGREKKRGEPAPLMHWACEIVPFEVVARSR